MSHMTHVWAWAKYPTDSARKGHACRVLARSLQMNSCLIEFEDGYRVVTSRNGLRRITSADTRKEM